MPQRLRYAELAPEGTHALRQLEHYLNTATALGPVLLEFCRLRSSLLNGCDFCIAMHRAELAKHNEPASRVDAVEAWQASDAFTPRERAALAWTDAVTNVQQGHVSDAAFAEISAYFENKDLADLTMAIASINAWNRLAIAFRAEWKPRQAGSAQGGQHQAEHSGAEPGAALTHQGAGPAQVPDRASHPERSPSDSIERATTEPSGAETSSPRPVRRSALDDDGGKVVEE